MIKLPHTGNPHLGKDRIKASKANKMIAYGSVGSSSYKYAKANPELVNTGNYSPDDIVFVSVNGMRPHRITINDPKFRRELGLAVKAEVTFITDNLVNRNRNYNIGERELAEYLKESGYLEVDTSGTWKPQPKSETNYEH